MRCAPCSIVFSRRGRGPADRRRAIGALFCAEPVRAQTADTPARAGARSGGQCAGETTLPAVRVRGTSETASLAGDRLRRAAAAAPPPRPTRR